MRFWTQYRDILLSALAAIVSGASMLALPRPVTFPWAPLMLLGGGLGLYAAYVNRVRGTTPFGASLVPGTRSHALDGIVLAVLIAVFCAVAIRPITPAASWQAILVYMPIGLWALTSPGRTVADKIAVPLLWVLVLVGLPALVLLLLVDLWQQFIVHYIASTAAGALAFLVTGAYMRTKCDETARWIGTTLVLGALAVLAAIVTAFLLPAEFRKNW